MGEGPGQVRSLRDEVTGLTETGLEGSELDVEPERQPELEGGVSARDWATAGLVPD